MFMPRGFAMKVPHSSPFAPASQPVQPKAISDTNPTQSTPAAPSRKALGGLAALLVGFPRPEAEAGAAILRAAGWHQVLIDGGTNVPQIMRRESVTMVVIDVDHCDDYAPRLIAELRDEAASQEQIRIIALAVILPEGLSRQLHDAGADRVLTKRGGQPAGDWVANLP